MESFEDDDLLLPLAGDVSQAASPIPKPMMRRLKKASSQPRVPDLPPMVPSPDLNPSPSAAPSALPVPRLVPDLEELVAHRGVPVLGSDEIEEENCLDEEELDPLFPDLGASEGWEPQDMEIAGEDDEGRIGGIDWIGESGGSGTGEMADGFGKKKSAKKRLGLEGGEGEEEQNLNQKKKKKREKKSMSDGKPKEPIRDKRRLEKERKAQLVHIHAESQRLLRETRDASFRPVPLVQKPISSVLEKIRLRKLEVQKKFSIVHHSGSTNKDTDPMEFGHDTELPISQKETEDDKDLKIVFSDAYGSDVGGVGRTLSISCNVRNNKIISDDFEDTSGDNNLLDETLNEEICDLSLPSSSSDILPADVLSSEEDNDKENIDPQPYKQVKKGSHTEGALKVFLDDEAEEEDDSDHDLMRFQENEEEDESDENEVLNDLIATGFKEDPVDHEKCNQLHQMWLEQQDAAATDNVLQRLKYGQKKNKPSILDVEDDLEELCEEVEEEESYDQEESYELPPANMVRKNSKLAKQMIAQMFTDDHDIYEPSDDEETEDTLVRQRLSKQTEKSAFVSPLEDESSREIFGLIRKLNIAPDAKKKQKTKSNFDMLITRGSNNSSSKSSFLGRASSSMNSSHKQGSATVRAFIFGSDDSNIRTGLSTYENPSKVEQRDDQPKKTSAKLSKSQLKSTTTRAKVEAPTSSGSSLFEILRQSSINFDKQMKGKISTIKDVTGIEAAHQFSAFKLERRFSKA